MKTDCTDSPARRAVVVAWALVEGYAVAQESWYDEEGVEAWVWFDRAGERLGGAIGGWDELPTMPDDLFDRLNAECYW